MFLELVLNTCFIIEIMDFETAMCRIGVETFYCCMYVFKIDVGTQLLIEIMELWRPHGPHWNVMWKILLLLPLYIFRIGI